MTQIPENLMIQMYNDKVEAADKRHRVSQAIRQLRARDELSRAVFRAMKLDGNVQTLMEEFPALIRQAEARLCRRSQPCRAAHQ